MNADEMIKYNYTGEERIITKKDLAETIAFLKVQKTEKDFMIENNEFLLAKYKEESNEFERLIEDLQQMLIGKKTHP